MMMMDDPAMAMQNGAMLQAMMMQAMMMQQSFEGDFGGEYDGMGEEEEEYYE